MPTKPDSKRIARTEPSWQAKKRSSRSGELPVQPVNQSRAIAVVIPTKPESVSSLPDDNVTRESTGEDLTVTLPSPKGAEEDPDPMGVESGADTERDTGPGPDEHKEEIDQAPYMGTRSKRKAEEEDDLNDRAIKQIRLFLAHALSTAEVETTPDQESGIVKIPKTVEEALHDQTYAAGGLRQC